MAGELRAMFGGDIMGTPEAGYPVTNESFYTGLSGRVRQWYGFRLLGKSIDDSKEVLHALRLCQGD